MLRWKLGWMLAVCLFALPGLVVEADARRVRLGIPFPGANMLTFYVGKDKGYFAEEGLEVEMILMRSPVANLALIAGELHFTAIPTSALTSALRGSGLKTFSAPVHRPIFWLYAKKEISDIQGLRGKKVGSSGGASAPNLLLQAILKRHGLKAGRDVTILRIAGHQRLTSLKAGFIDASMFAMPDNFRADQAGFRQLVDFIGEEEFVLFGGSVVTRGALTQSDPELVKKFLRATLKAQLSILADRAGSVKILMKNVKLKQDMAGKSYDVLKRAMSSDGTVGEGVLKKYLDFVRKSRGITASPPVSKFFDFSLIREIGKELDAKGWKP